MIRFDSFDRAFSFAAALWRLCAFALRLDAGDGAQQSLFPIHRHAAVQAPLT